jgi:hypothetical protein
MVFLETYQFWCKEIKNHHGRWLVIIESPQKG